MHEIESTKTIVLKTTNEAFVMQYMQVCIGSTQFPDFNIHSIYCCITG